LDRRLHAFRDDLADARLRGRVTAPRYVAGREAVVVVGRALVRREPAPDAPLDTFYHHGERVLTFEVAGEYAWCQSQLDGYVGYVAARHVAIGSAPTPSHFIATMGSYLYADPDLRSEAADFLPRHSAVVVAEGGLTTRGTEYVRVDRGGFLPRACLSEEPPRSVDIVEAAERYLGCPYLWGGRSFLGIDCSGLVQNAFRDLGISILRDTDMQRDTIGTAVSVQDEMALRRGDLIYIPGHVMLYAGAGDVIHADGVTMMARREKLAPLMRLRGLDFAVFVIRRPAA
jgi:cell wall-associated NlpC family hydrolase